VAESKLDKLREENQHLRTMNQSLRTILDGYKQLIQAWCDIEQSDKLIERIQQRYPQKDKK
jgi:hypothetical protein